MVLKVPGIPEVESDKKLRPCPFCGCEKIYVLKNEDPECGRTTYAVTCAGCACLGPWEKSLRGCHTRLEWVQRICLTITRPRN